MDKYRALSESRAFGSFIVDRSMSAMNKENDIFVFTASIKDEYKLKVGDSIIFHQNSYEVIEIKEKKKALTTFYAKILKHGNAIR